jgi:hypothetical protein
MPIDASIPLQIKAPQIQDPINAMMRVMQMKGLQGEQDAREFEMGQRRQAYEDQNAMQRALRAPGADPAQVLLQHGKPKEASDWMNAAATRKKSEADAKKIDYDMALSQAQHAASVLSLAKDPTSYTTVRQVLASMAGPNKDQFLAQFPEMFDPAFVQAKIAEGQTITQRLADERAREQNATALRGQDVTAATTMRGQDMTQQTAREGHGVTIRGQDVSASTTRRGQDLTNARALDANNINREAARTELVQTPEGVIAVDKGTRQGTPVTVGGQPIPGKVPESVTKELTSINQQRSVISGALDAVKKTPSAFSLTRGVATMAGAVPESVAGRFDSDAERQARAYVFNNVSKVINERAGAAQSAQELARLRSFLPADTDEAPQIESKLNAFNTYLNDLEKGTRAPRAGAPAANQRTVVRTGTQNGRKVVQYSDGSIEYAN